MDNKKAGISCLNCKHSYRDEEGILRCFRGHMTSCTASYDCNDYKIFSKNKEELIFALIREINR